MLVGIIPLDFYNFKSDINRHYRPANLGQFYGLEVERYLYKYVKLQYYGLATLLKGQQELPCIHQDWLHYYTLAGKHFSKNIIL